MATLAAYYQSFASLPFFKGFVEQRQMVKPRVIQAHPAFNHALAALAAKLAISDGPITKSEYHAFEALFGSNDVVENTRLRTQFVKHLGDNAPALQFARQIAAMTEGNRALHHDLLQRLLSIATADAVLNAVEMEWLRAVADIFTISGDDFRAAVSRHITPATSPYAVLGVAPTISDAELRPRYMAQVQKVHPDRFQAAGASAETVALLSDQLAALNAAYQQVRATRATKKQSPVFGRRNTKSAKAAA